VWKCNRETCFCLEKINFHILWISRRLSHIFQYFDIYQKLTKPKAEETFTGVFLGKLFQIKLTIGVKLVSICKIWPRTGMRNRGVPQRCLAQTPGTSEVPGMYPRYHHKGAQLISGKATHGMPCKIGQNALWYMRVMVWYKCEICDFTFWPGDTSLRAQKQNSP